jgi:Domain of unknown function (DUF4189)
MSSIQKVRGFVLFVACVSAAAFLLTAPASAKDDEKGASIVGEFESYRSGVLTIIIGVKDDGKGNGSGSPARVKVDSDFKVVLYNGDETKEAAAGNVFTDKLEKGAKVTINFDGDKKLTRIEVGGKNGGYKYAAIAYSPTTGAYGFGNKFDSRKGAEDKALAECKADDAKVAGSVKNGWCILAVGDFDASIYACGDNSDKAEARKTAMAECGKLVKPCHIVSSVSSEGRSEAVK